MPEKLTQQTFIQKARTVHGNKYSYAKVAYVGSETKVTIYCRTCKSYFEQRPGGHLHGRGCRKCGARSQGNKLSMTLTEFKRKAKSVHGNKFSYAKVELRGSMGKVKIKCNTCKTVFEQTPNRHLAGCGCKACRVAEVSGTTENFITRSMEIHGNKFDYSKTIYKTKRTPLLVCCTSCGEISTRTPVQHLYGMSCTNIGCENHSVRGYSKIAIRWLQHEAKKRRIKIEHAENGGEYRIPGTRLLVDGFHRHSNTVFEFHGDAYHGNPDVYGPRSHPNPYSIKTASQLYKATVKRENLIKSLGYNLVVMWQYDWLNP